MHLENIQPTVLQPRSLDHAQTPNNAHWQVFTHVRLHQETGEHKFEQRKVVGVARLAHDAGRASELARLFRENPEPLDLVLLVHLCEDDHRIVLECEAIPIAARLAFLAVR